MADVSLRLILSVEALEPRLSGIGRYNWALASRVANIAGVDEVRFWRSGHWIADPAALLDAGQRPPRDWRPRWVRDLAQRRFGRTHLFHGPNYFLPDWAEGGVVTVHDLSVLRYPDMHPADRLAHFERRFARSLAIAGHIVTDSETVRQEVIDSFSIDPARVTAVHLGVDAAFNPRSDAETRPVLARYGLVPGGYALCVSTVEPRKRIPELLRAWSLLPPAVRSRWPLMVTGGAGWLSDDVKSLMQEGQRAGWVRYLGFVPEADLPFLYAGAALFVYPSVYEGFGLPPAEAMASGVPVVTSDASCLPEIAGGAAMLVNPQDVPDFAERIAQALQDEHWRSQARSKGLVVAAKYDWDACASHMVALYKRVYAQ